MRCFIALGIDEKIREKLAKVAHELRMYGKPVEPENLHITLLFLGETRLSEIPSILAAVNMVNERYPPRVATYECVGAFPSLQRPRVVWVGVQDASLAKMYVDLCTLLHRPAERFTPHVTLARIREGARIPPSFFERYKNEVFGSAPTPPVVLMQSTLTPQGPKYTVIKDEKEIPET